MRDLITRYNYTSLCAALVAVALTEAIRSEGTRQKSFALLVRVALKFPISLQTSYMRGKKETMVGWYNFKCISNHIQRACVCNKYRSA